MNGANNDEEMDRTPLHLCPICLRRLCSVPMLAGHGTAAVDVRQRYADLREEFAAHGMREEAEWVELWLRELPTESRPESRPVKQRSKSEPSVHH